MHSLTRWLEQPATDSGITFYDGSCWQRRTYAEFAGDVLAAAAQLREHGVIRLDRVALALPSGPSFARYFFATMLLGATPTPIAPPGYHGTDDYADFAQSRLATLRPSCVVTETAIIKQLVSCRLSRPRSGATSPRVVNADDPMPAGGLELLNPLGPDELALIQFTSGSSSAPRGVTLTRSAILSQIDILAEIVGGFGADESFSSWLPLHHDMGLIGLFITPVIIGAELWLMRPEQFVRRPIDWLATFGERGVRRSATPCFGLAQVVRRVTPDQLAGMDFSDWQSLMVGADRVSYDTLASVHRLLAPHGLSPHTMTPAYGMAEATLAVVATRRTAAPSAVVLESVDFSSGAAVRVVGERRLGAADAADAAEVVGAAEAVGAAEVVGHSVVSCGHEPAGVEVTVVDEAGGSLPDGHVGELRVRTPALSRGYLGDPVENERFTAGGYLTGDLGFRRDNQTYVLGRVGDSVKVNGRFVTAEDVELALARALTVPHDRIAVVLRDIGDGPATLVTVQQRLASFQLDPIADVIAAFGLDPLRFAVLRVPRRAVPRTTSGKPRRGQLWRELETGALTGEIVYLGGEFPFRFGVRVAAVAPLRIDLGGKGYHLTVMQSEHLPVPPFAVLSAGELAAGPLDLTQLRRRLHGLVSAAASVLGVAESTVGLAVRSSPPHSMPGMMDTLLGLGLRCEDLDPLADRLGSRDAAAETLVGQATHLCSHVAAASAEQLRTATGCGLPAQRRYERLAELFTELTGRPYPTGRAEQVSAAVAAVRASWQSARARKYRLAYQIPDHPGPAVVVQAMAYGAASGISGSGVVFSHNPLNGEPGLFGEFLPSATGEALVSGTRTPEPITLLREHSVEVFRALRGAVDHLYRVLRAMVDVEFVVERGRLWLVQVRPASASPQVLNRVCAQAWQEGLVPAREALLRLDVDALFAPMPARARPRESDRLLAVGLPASPGATHGPVATSVDDVLTHPPATAVLLRPTTEPSDFAGMMHAAALLTRQGGNTSHAAVVARELGLPAVVALTPVHPQWEALTEVTVCGTTGQVWAGRLPITAEAAPPRPAGLLAEAVSTAIAVGVCLPPSPPERRSPSIVDRETGAPLGVAVGPVPTALIPKPPLAALVCAVPTALPNETTDQVVATGDRATAEEWALKGGRVVFLHPPLADQPWRTQLPDCDLVAVVLAGTEQLEHARWLLGQRAARAFGPDDA